MELKPGLSALVTGGASGIGELEQRRLRSIPTEPQGGDRG